MSALAREPVPQKPRAWPDGSITEHAQRHQFGVVDGDPTGSCLQPGQPGTVRGQRDGKQARHVLTRAYLFPRGELHHTRSPSVVVRSVRVAKTRPLAPPRPTTNHTPVPGSGTKSPTPPPVPKDTPTRRAVAHIHQHTRLGVGNEFTNDLLGAGAEQQTPVRADDKDPRTVRDDVEGTRLGTGTVLDQARRPNRGQIPHRDP